MRSQVKHSSIAIATVAVIATMWGTSPVIGQSASGYKAPRTADGHPDLNGIWQALNTAYWNIEAHGAEIAPHYQLVGTYLAQPPGLSVVEGGTIPYKPEALAKRKQHLENRLKPDVNLVLDNSIGADMADPEAKCFQGGVPRVNYMPYPFQVIQSKDAVVMAYQYGSSTRMIYLDRDFKDLFEILSWMGQSVGRWDGDSLVVTTKWFDGTSLPAIWLDRAGNYYSEKAVVTERYTRASPDHLTYEATIDDSSVFTRPWTIRMPLYRRVEPDMELLEFQCIPFAEEFMYGQLIKQHNVSGLQKGRPR